MKEEKEKYPKIDEKKNITSSRRTVRLGLLQRVYERFPIKK